MEAKIESYLNHLQLTEHYDKEMEMSIWKENPFIYDLSVTRCTSSAMLIALKFGGSVFGYEVDQEHPKTIIGFDCGGHDFCIVENFIVDYWAKYVNDPKLKAVIDMSNPANAEYIKNHYLDKAQWESLELWPTVESVIAN